MKKNISTVEKAIKPFWRWPLLSLVFISLATANSFGQAVNAYFFTHGTGGAIATLSSPITLINSGADDVSSAVTTFSGGFSFTFRGTSFTQFSVSSNGALNLGGTVCPNTYINDIASVGSNIKITPFWDDIVISGAGVRYKVLGAAPNRTAVFIWNGNDYTTGAGIQFQVTLFEATNVIRFDYGAGTGGTANIGICNSTTEFESVTVTNNTISSVTPNNSVGWPDPGTYYMFTPTPPGPTVASFLPLNGCATVTPVAITGTNFTGVTSVKFGGINAQSYTVNSSTSITAVPANGTTGTVSVTTSEGTGTSTATFTVNSLPTIASAGTDQNICGASATLTANTPTVGTGTWSIVSGSGGSIAAESGASSTFAGSPGTTYSLRWTISNTACASSTDDVTINLNSIPAATGSVLSNAICTSHNGSATVSVSGGASPYNYSWSNGSSSQIISGLSEGGYSVTVTDANGCNISTSITVNNISATVSALVSSTDAICSASNGSATASASGGNEPYSYAWSNGSVANNISGLSAGTYSVSITDANSCSTSTSVIVNTTSTVVSALVSSTDAICSASNGSASVSASGGSGPYSYVWSNGSASNNISGLSAGTYSVSITDANGCSTSTSVTVNNTSAVVSASVSSVDARCNGNNGSITLTVNAGAEPYSFTWSNGASSENISGISEGGYSVIITDVNGCSSTVSATIANSSVTVTTSILSSKFVCSGSTNGTATVTATGGESPYAYNWSNGSTTQTAIGLAPGNYSVIVTDAYGCSTSGSAIIPSKSAPLQPDPIVTAIPLAVCPPVNGVFLQTNNDPNSKSYSWTSDATGISFINHSSTNVQTINIGTSTNSTYVVHVTARNECGTSPLRGILFRRSVTVPLIFGPSEVRGNTTQSYSCSNVGAATYKWKGTAGMLINGKQPPYISKDTVVKVTYTLEFSDGSIAVAGTIACFTSAYKTLPVSKILPSLSLMKASTETKGQSQNLESMDNNSFNLQAYPDADQKTMTFTFNASEEGSFSYSLYDESNREVLNGTIDAQEGVNMNELDMSSFPVNTIFRLKLDNGKKSTHINIKMK